MEESKSTPVDLAVGDTVVARWLTPKKSERRIRGRVIELKPGKVKIKYSKTSSNGNSFSWEIKEVWRPREQVTKVKPRKNEKDPSEGLKNFMEVLVGKEPTPGPDWPPAEHQ